MVAITLSVCKKSLLQIRRLYVQTPDMKMIMACSGNSPPSRFIFKRQLGPEIGEVVEQTTAACGKAGWRPQETPLQCHCWEKPWNAQHMTLHLATLTTKLGLNTGVFLQGVSGMHSSCEGEGGYGLSSS